MSLFLFFYNELMNLNIISREKIIIYRLFFMNVRKQFGLDCI